jgi:adenylate cyclase
MSSSRRLAAILAADVAGYSRLMGADEEGTLERLKALRRELVDPKIAEHHGLHEFHCYSLVPAA